MPTNEDQVKIRTVLEAAAKIFRRPVNPAENFFDMGGDSISALRLVALVKDAGYALSIEDVFDQPDFAALALDASPLILD